MSDNTGIPAPPSGTIVDTDPTASQIPPPPSGTIVDAAPQTPHDLTVEEYSALPTDQQKAYDKHIREGRSVLDPATGFIKSVGSTVNTLSGLISRVAPSIVRPSDVAGITKIETPSNFMQQVGSVGESIAEFFLGDEALQALPIAKRLKMATEAAEFADSHPVIAKIMGHGIQAIRGGAVTTGQQLAHGASPSDALKTGAEATALGTGVGAAIEGAGALKNAVSESAAQAPLQAGIRQTAGRVAQEAEVVAPKTPSMYKTVEEVGDNVLDKAKDLYQTLDEATGGKVQRFRDRLDNIRQQLNGLTGTEEDAAKEASLLKAQKETEEAMQEAFAEAKTKGVDPDTLKQADQIFKQSQALYDLDTAVQRSTSGKPAGVGTKGLPETVDPKKLAPRVTALWKSDRLQQALGEEHATDLMDYVGEAAKHQQTAIKIKGFLKMAGIATGLLGGGTVVGHVVHALGQ